MINLLAPKEGENRYIIFRGFAIGPYDPTMKMEGEAISLPSKLETMTETKGIWHENSVSHYKVNGDLVYHPILGGALRSPTTVNPIYPDRLVLPVYNSVGQPITVTANYGMAFDRAISRWTAASNVWGYTCIEKKPDGLWTAYEVSGSGLIPGSTWNAWIYDMTSLDSMNASLMYYHQKRTQFAYRLGITSKPDSYDFDTIKACVLTGKSLGPVTQSAYSYWYKARLPNDQVLSPSRMQEHIDAIVAQLVPESFPVLDEHYGDLAMVATEKVNANHVNMIAFLRDLRHPTEMIPKLRNLRKLLSLRKVKEISSDYLAIQYGILPTVSDLQAIVDAFTRMKPYLDRNGFDVYTAYATNSLERDGITYQLEQRIKIAIGNEDSDFCALLNRLESIGFMPTYENIWDLVPYSFVLDWFIDVGTFLERVDTRLRVMRLDIRYATMSRKAKIQGTLAWDALHPYSGPVTWEHYHRWVSDQCPVPPLSLQTTTKDFDHWLESFALTVQRIR